MHLAYGTPPHLMIYAWDRTNMDTVETERGLSSAKTAACWTP